MTQLLLIVAVVVAVVGSAAPAQAYLDPGTGSMILQVLLGGIAGIAVIVKLYWRKIKAFFGLAPAADPAAENERVSE
jgi:hypothetical protein